MKRKRFSLEQIVGVLKQAEVGVPVVFNGRYMTLAHPYSFGFFFVAHRVSAAFLAISLRRAFERALARDRPPTRPPCIPMSRRCSALRTSARRFPPSLPSATACGFFGLCLFVTTPD